MPRRTMLCRLRCKTEEDTRTTTHWPARPPMFDNLLAHAASWVHLAAFAHSHLLRGHNEGHRWSAGILMGHPNVDRNLVRRTTIVDGQCTVQKEEEGSLPRVERCALVRGGDGGKAKGGGGGLTEGIRLDLEGAIRAEHAEYLGEDTLVTRIWAEDVLEPVARGVERRHGWRWMMEGCRLDSGG